MTTDVFQESFKVSRSFYDDKNYPRGMARSGDFTLKESQLLIQYGVALMDLSTGKRTPVTDLEQHFVDVCNDKANVENDIEKAWIKYHNFILSPKQFHTLFGRTKLACDESEMISDDSDDSEDSNDSDDLDDSVDSTDINSD